MKSRKKMAKVCRGSLERGLAVLIAINRRKHPSVVELARDTNLPRPTVHRLMGTLERGGFVTRNGPRDRYCLAHRVLALSDGFAEDDWISDVAGPLMRRFTQEHVWPLVLMTFEEGRMRVRFTTHQASPLSIDHGMVGRSLPMLRTAAGRCYLAFCTAPERRAIREMLARSKAPLDQGARDTRRLSKLIDATRQRGYALQDREINPKATAVAIPVCVGSRVLGTLSLVWISSGLTIRQAETRLLPPLQSTGARIADAIRDRALEKLMPLDFS